MDLATTIKTGRALPALQDKQDALDLLTVVIAHIHHYGLFVSGSISIDSHRTCLYCLSQITGKNAIPHQYIASAIRSTVCLECLIKHHPEEARKGGGPQNFTISYDRYVTLCVHYRVNPMPLDQPLWEEDAKHVAEKWRIEKLHPKAEPQQLQSINTDAPLCPICGCITVRNGRCHVCPGCGETIGGCG